MNYDRTGLHVPRKKKKRISIIPKKKKIDWVNIILVIGLVFLITMWVFLR